MGRDKKTKQLPLVLSFLSYCGVYGNAIPVSDIAKFFGETEEETSAILTETFNTISSLNQCLVEGDVLTVWRDDNSSTYTIPLLLTKDETAAFAMALAQTGFMPNSELVQKISTASSSATFENANLVLSSGATTEISERLSNLAFWISSNHCVRFQYRNEGQRNYGALRDVEPYRIFSEDGKWYLDAYCLQSQDWKTFRVDRMTNLECLPNHVKHQDQFIASQSAIPSFDNCSLAHISFGPGASFIANKWPGARRISKECTEDTETYSVPYANTNWIARKILSEGEGVHVSCAPEVEKSVRALAKATLKEYEELQ